jgi:SAM-dependent methyltransferase
MRIEGPIDVATRHTADFIASHLRAGDDLIEVGCGGGHLAAELGRRGFAVTGVDADAARIAEAQALGVRGVVAQWPDYDGAAAAAVAFTRSLHHNERLDAAVARAAVLTRPGGRLVLEDFAHDEVDPRALDWFAGVLHSPRAAALIMVSTNAPRLAGELMNATDRPAAWRRYHTHDHRLHSTAAMRDAIAAEYAVQAEARVPYLYRYLVPLLPGSAEAASLVADTFSDEARRAAGGEFVPVGWRLAAFR